MNSEYENIEIGLINTDESAKRFAKYLSENKTFFLDGKWGSGKSEFIKKASHYLHPKVLISVDLWRTTDNKTVTEIIFSKLCKKTYRIMTYSVIPLVALSILCSDKVNLGLTFGSNFLDALSKIVIWTLTTLTILYQFFFRTPDNIFILFFNKYHFKNRILLIDDFDRVTEDKQEEAYKIFNILNGKLPVLFVGDYEKLTKNEDNYLQKIIDQKIVLPFNLNSSEITKNTNLPLSIKQLFKSENRVIRELVQYLERANQELKMKFKNVQIEQQLVIVYTYLFYPQIYSKLKSGWLPEEIEVDSDKDFINILSELLKPNQNNPKDYSSNSQAYLLYESATNLDIVEFNKIFEDDAQLKYYLEHEESDDKKYNEVRHYMEGIPLDEWVESAERIEKLGIQQLEKRVEPNELSKFIFRKKLELIEQTIRSGSRYMNFEFGEGNEFSSFLITQGLQSRRGVSGEVRTGSPEVAVQEIPFIFSEIDGLLETASLDISQKFYFYHKFLQLKDTFISYEHGSLITSTPRINEKNVLKHFEPETQQLLDSDKYLRQKFPEQILISKLGFYSDSLIEDNLRDLEDKIKKLTDKDFKLFWNFYDVKPVKYKGEIVLNNSGKLSSVPDISSYVLERLKHC